MSEPVPSQPPPTQSQPATCHDHCPMCRHPVRAVSDVALEAAAQAHVDYAHATRTS